jgi:DNA-binding NarL/FixJ family response regulator
LLLDLNIPKLEALPVLLALREQELKTKIIILSLEPNESKLLNAAKAGARGYILKSTSLPTLIDAVREVSRGRIWVDRQVGCADTFALLAHRASTGDAMEPEINPLDVLSKRELQVLHLIAKGVTNEEIGKKLFISVPTVKAHVANIFKKLGVENRTKAALLLMQTRLQSSRDFAPQSSLFDFTLGTHPISRKGTTEVGRSEATKRF